MAKYDVKFSCGHEGTVELFGKSADRERKIAYFEKHGVCSECYKMQQAAAVAEKTAAWELPELTGTPKQIAWAERIRAEVFDKYGAHMQADKSEKTQAFMSFLMAQSSAKYWIDRQDATIRGLAQEWMKGEGK